MDLMTRRRAMMLAAAGVPMLGPFTLLASGSYTVSGTQAGALSIPVSFVGTAKLLVVSADEELQDIGQTLAAARALPEMLSPLPWASAFPEGFGQYRVKTANNSGGHLTLASTQMYLKDSGATLYVMRASNNYYFQPNTYHWYIYG
ncbi:MAG: hypothetical protein IJK63_11305 [Oscillospiraceae bacterium]|nr:hypothetical protein [Oscillospiraceae bacterium]